MARILHINASYKPAFIYGGPTVSVSNLCEELSKTETVEVYTTTANGKNELSVERGVKVLVDGVHVTYFSRLTGDHSHFSPGLIWRYITHLHQFDIIHIHAWWNSVSVLCLFLGVLWGKNVILTPRGTLSTYTFQHQKSLFKKGLFFISKFFLRKCHFHVTSPQEKSEILQLLKPKSISNIPNLIKLPRIQSKEEPTVNYRKLELKSKNTENVFKLLFISRIDEKKGLELLFASLKEVNIGWHLTIAGLGLKEYTEKLIQLSKDYGIDHKISWVGFLDYSQKFKVMKDHDLMVLPSQNENFANIVIECLSTGTAVLISNEVGLAEFVDRTKMGWTFDRQKAILIDLINRIPELKENLEQIRMRAPEVIEQEFGIKKLTMNYLEFYKFIQLNSASLIASK